MPSKKKKHQNLGYCPKFGDPPPLPYAFLGYEKLGYFFYDEAPPPPLRELGHLHVLMFFKMLKQAEKKHPFGPPFTLVSQY